MKYDLQQLFSIMKTILVLLTEYFVSMELTNENEYENSVTRNMKGN